MTSKIHKLGGSQSAFQWGNLTFTNSKAGCLRAILLKSRGVTEGDIPQHYKAIGERNEEYYRDEVAEIAGLEYKREMVFKGPISQFPGVTYSSRADFVYLRDGLPIQIVELKAISSYAKQREVIDAGHYVPENLAQLVSYMLFLEVIDGQLLYTRWKNKNLSKSAKDNLKSTDKNDYEVVVDRMFNVHIDTHGRINVDGMPTKFVVGDVLAHQYAAAKVMTEGLVGNRPVGYDAVFGSPCNYCVFKDTCDKYDRGEIGATEEFIEEAKTCLNKTNEEGDG